MRAARILVLSAATVALVATAFHLSRSDTPVAAAAQPTWLQLPGMDAQDPGIRQLLLGNAHLESEGAADPSPFLSLVGRCGYDNSPAEQYVATIGDHWFVQDRHVWRITLSMYGDTADVVIRDANLMPPPPPDSGYRRVIAPATRHVLDRSELEDIRAAWRDPDLWLAPQARDGCFDGHTLVLEACVNGRYGARSRACGSTGRTAGRLLWQRLRARFPDPPPARWQ